MIRLGVIGLSEGNGHAYAWSAIINGYEAAAMENCGFPVIPRYLEAAQANDNRLPGAEVTHVWTQDQALSRNLAAACRIPHIVARPEEMIGQVDAILLARDDAENHLQHALPFLEARLPIFIDQPLAHSVAGAEDLLAWQRFPSQLFTCSALRYGLEFTPLLAMARSGAARWTHIRAVTPKSWPLYALHVIEPVIMLLSAHARSTWGSPIGLEDFPAGEAQGVAIAPTGVTQLQAVGPGGVTLSFAALGGSTRTGGLRFEFFSADEAPVEIVFKDSYSAFRRSLQHFLAGLEDPQVPLIPRGETLACLRLLEQGIPSPA